MERGPPQVQFASENSIAITYSAYHDFVPTITAEALDMVIKHCEKHGKGMKLVSSRIINSLEELHTFMCTNDFTDERIEVKVK